MRTFIIKVALLCAAGYLTGFGAEPATGLDALVANSPFGQVRGGPGGGDAANQPLEFRGILEEGNSCVFSIYDTASHHSSWVGLNVSSDDFVVKEYDAAHQTLSVNQNGRILTLALKSAPKVAQANPIVRPGPMPMPNQNPGMNNGPMLQPGAGGPDAQRLQQIAQEIERRRALRRQASGAPPVPMPNQPPNP